jgi:hypothetical protein
VDGFKCSGELRVVGATMSDGADPRCSHGQAWRLGSSLILTLAFLGLSVGLCLVTVRLIAGAWADCGVGGSGGRAFLSIFVFPALVISAGLVWFAARRLVHNGPVAVILAVMIAVGICYVAVWALATPSDYPPDDRATCLSGNVPAWWPWWLPS